LFKVTVDVLSEFGVAVILSTRVIIFSFFIYAPLTSCRLCTDKIHEIKRDFQYTQILQFLRIVAKMYMVIILMKRFTYNVCEINIV
jgi:hypothetical protein